MRHDPSSPYGDLLESAYALGRADGRFAARLEPADPPPAPCACCQGRSPEAFARFLWGDQPGEPPSGLELNAPLWYARGFAEAVTAERLRAERQRDESAWARLGVRLVPWGDG